MGGKPHPVFADKTATKEDRERVKRQAMRIRNEKEMETSDDRTDSEDSDGEW